MLSAGRVHCDVVCDRIDDARMPGEWIDASELMRGGSLHNRPELWID